MAKAASMADELFAKLEASILSGALQPGEQMPTQKAIAESEEVSRTVVREAVARLEAQGLVVARQGSGVYVAEDARYRAFQVTRNELSELADVIRLLETRLAIETEMAAFAAARRSTEDIAAMRIALRHMAQVSDDPIAAAAADVQFHLAIARATRNDYFVRLIDFLGLRLVPPRNLYLRDQPDDAHQAYVAKVRAEHEAILDAITRMDVPRARQAAWDHMQESLNRHSELSDVELEAQPPANTP
ncbi:GntR family transcriptional repressor for pyruvate dehydrogenase complex [Sphingomonas sp. SORGH_AS 950]|uniref:FadR/GntR family transcriptional regulator n=1 Tax=Sphingomonas sp. SORGH_AS_0950 TaxID=3041792 RepID=UPI002788E642|nr:FadR/GntR family transcriptional regulator [Sphingomonas sp. SORGH_AS_0950]MDQ1159214.1 GntR family transcriptional repressor for pyruvate dehydrogenase complex [Sphingomonas sp. SORGH_AS_0950]